MATRGRLLSSIGFLLLGLWVVWWLQSFAKGELLGAGHTWMTHPALGADFWSQTDYAARRWLSGQSPYGDEWHVFHYPPIVVRLFAWTPLLPTQDALIVWTIVNVATVCAGTWVAYRHRLELGLGRLPFSLTLALVLYSFPVLFQLERANFDLITLLAILLCLAISRRGFRHADVLAGVVLSVGPWVKLYPGLLFLSLLALRRFRMLAGFVVGGLAIGLAAPAETLHSFEVLRRQVVAVRPVVLQADYFLWGHSLTNVWAKAAHAASATEMAWMARVPAIAFAALILVPIVGWVHYRIARARPRGLEYPLFLWTVSAASFVPEIANDYSLVFLPLAAVAVYRLADPWHVHLGLALMLVWLQPVMLPIDGRILLIVKVAGLAAIGGSLVERARSARTEHGGLTSAGDAPDFDARREVTPAIVGDSVQAERVAS